VRLLVDEAYATALFSSCKDVTVSATGQKAVDMAFGGALSAADFLRFQVLPNTHAHTDTDTVVDGRDGGLAWRVTCRALLFALPSLALICWPCSYTPTSLVYMLHMYICCIHPPLSSSLLLLLLQPPPPSKQTRDLLNIR
jgi:hypothetical protein